MTTPDLGRLERVPLRSAWLSESGDFTPWLALPENLKLLGETLEIDLELEKQEKSVGAFRADILCQNLADSSWVLIENQLERTDHTHLGQLLTYAAGLTAVTIVWIAQHFTEEHRAALDWLNEKTPDGVAFFGLELELWRIGNSQMAPKFNIVSKPNEWTRQAIVARTVGPNTVPESHKSYWPGVYDLLRTDGILTDSAKPMRRKDTRFDVGWKDFHLKAYFSLSEPKHGVWLACRGPNGVSNFSELKKHRVEIEKAYGATLDWTEREETNSGSISEGIAGYDANQAEDWPRQQQMLAEKIRRLYYATKPFVQALPASETQEDLSDPFQP